MHWRTLQSRLRFGQSQGTRAEACKICPGTDATYLSASQRRASLCGLDGCQYCSAAHPHTARPIRRYHSYAVLCSVHGQDSQVHCILNNKPTVEILLMPQLSMSRTTGWMINATKLRCRACQLQFLDGVSLRDVSLAVSRLELLRQPSMCLQNSQLHKGN